MTKLYSFELKKIFQKKAFWVTLIIGLVLCMAAASANSLFDSYEYPDGSKISGFDYYQNEAKECGKLSGRVIDDAFLDEVREKIVSFALSNNYVTEQDIEDIKAGKISNEYIAISNNTQANSPLVGLDSAAEQLGIADAWYFMMDAVNDNSKLMTINGDEFQKAFRDNIELPDNNKEYWKNEAAKIQNPVVYNYDEPLLFFLDSGFFLVWFLFILIAVSISGAFADERSSRMDALIISTVKGKTPTAIAKLLAGATVAAGATVLVFLSSALSCYINHGKFYPTAIIQMLDPENAYNMTYGSAIIKQFICTLILALLFTAVTVLLSEVMTSTAVMGIQTGILMISFFNVPLRSELFNNLWRLRPTHFMNAWVENYSIFQFGTLQLNAIQMADVLWAIVAVLLSILAVILYKNCQVKSR